MTTITALHARLNLDVSNFSEGANLAKNEVNRVATIMRQSVPPADKYRQDLDLLNRAFSEAGKRSKEYADALEFLKRKHGQLPSAVNQSTSAIQANTAAADGAASTIKRLALQYLTFQTARSAIGIAADMETAAISFEVMAGSAEKGMQVLSDLRKFAASTPITLVGANNAARTLMAFGTEAEKVMPIIRMLGEVSGGSNDRFEQLALAFAQMRAAGRLMGQDLLQMVNAGFNPLQEISRRTGIEMIELKKRMEAGAISAKMVEDAFASAAGPTGRFGGMMARMANTASGAFEQLKSSVQEVTATTLAGLMPTLAATAKALERIVRATGGVISGLSFSEVRMLAMAAAFASALVIIPTVVAAVRGIVTALQAMAKAQILVTSLAGPKGWGLIAASLVAAALAAEQVDAAFERALAAPAAAGAADAVADIKEQADGLKWEFNDAAEAAKKVGASFQDQLTNLKYERMELLGMHDAVRRLKLAAEGYNQQQIQTLETIRAQNEMLRKRKEATEDVVRRREEFKDRFARDVADAVGQARAFFNEQQQRQEQRRKEVSAGPGAGMEVGSADAVKFFADQVNRQIGAAAVPQQPTPGEAEIVKKAADLFMAQQKANSIHERQLQKTEALLEQFKLNGFQRIR